MNNNPRLVAVVAGSVSDKLQLTKGLNELTGFHRRGQIELLPPVLGSQHRNTIFVQCLAIIFASRDHKMWQAHAKLFELKDVAIDILQIMSDRVAGRVVDVVVTAADRANHLSGCFDAFLRQTLSSPWPVVYGVSIEDDTEPVYTDAARLSTACVPGTTAIHSDGDGLALMGKKGFQLACIMAAKSDPYPDSVPLPKLKEPCFLL